MERFSIDESGYTGFDLLNADQRFQGASAVAIEDEDARKLIEHHFPKLQASELKYRALSKRPANHPRLIAMLRDLHEGYKCITYVCDKRYLLSLFFVDYAVEPFYLARGLDLYADGGNYAMASLLYIAGPVLLGQSGFDELLASFQFAVKNKNHLSKIRLVSAARNVDWKKLPEILGPLAKYAYPNCWEAISTPGVSTDAAMVVLQSLISRMEIMADAPYRVEHDQSKNLLAYHPLIQKLIEHDKEIEFHPTEISSWRFPLKLVEVKQVNSRESPAVQLADVMIGAALEMASNLQGGNAGGLNPNDVLSIYREGQIIHMLPSIDFEEQKRLRKGNQSSMIIDYFSRLLSNPNY